MVGGSHPRVGSSGRDVLAYFNNDGEGNAVRNALTLKGFLGIPAWPTGSSE